MPNTGAAPAIDRPTTQQTAAPQQLTSIQQLALQATVRVRVTDPDGTSKGTGTIIDLHGDEALILTCGHIFRASQGSGQIEVDLFAPGQGVRWPATYWSTSATIVTLV